MWGRLMNGIGAFYREAFLDADSMRSNIASGDFDTYTQFESCKLRYDLYRGLYENNAWVDGLHAWAPRFKTQRGLYKHIDGDYNPINRIVEFHALHMLGGRLDRKAGDGKKDKSALPIETDNEALRPAIAKLWLDSRWEIEKDILSREGAMLGDFGIKLEDDPITESIREKIIHPGTIKWLQKNSAKQVTAYILERWELNPQFTNLKTWNPLINPRDMKRVCRYNEEAFIQNGRCTYRTYRDGALFDWRGAAEGEPGKYPPEWEMPYDFVPLVVGQHISVGIEKGIAECHPLISKVISTDNLASILRNQVHKAVNAPGVITGAARPATPPVTGAPDQQATNSPGDPGPSRQQLGMLYISEVHAKFQHMTFDLHIDHVQSMIAAKIEEAERDYPELQATDWSKGDKSGRALRVSRQALETKVQARRPAYEEVVVTSQRMAMAMGELQGYEGYHGLGSDGDWKSKKLDHAIGHRPVFSPDPLDDIEEGQAFWTMVGAAVQAGMPLEIILEEEGYETEDLTKIKTALQAQQDAQLEVIKQQQDIKAVEKPPGAKQ